MSSTFVKPLLISILFVVQIRAAVYTVSSQQCDSFPTYNFCNPNNEPTNTNTTAMNAGGYCCTVDEAGQNCQPTDTNICVQGISFNNNQVYYANMVGITDEVCQTSTRNLIATAEKQTFSADKPTFVSTAQSEHPSCWYTIGIEEYKWKIDRSRIKVTFTEVTDKAKVVVFKGSDIANITDYIESNDTVAAGAPYYFQVDDPPVIVIGHTTNQIPGSFSFTYEVIGTEYYSWWQPYLTPDEQWKWTAIRWSIIMAPVVLLLSMVITILCCCFCKCCKRCCKCCRRDPNKLFKKTSDKQVIPIDAQDQSQDLKTNDAREKDVLEDEQEVELSVHSFEQKEEQLDEVNDEQMEHGKTLLNYNSDLTNSTQNLTNIKMAHVEPEQANSLNMLGGVNQLQKNEPAVFYKFNKNQKKKALEAYYQDPFAHNATPRRGETVRVNKGEN